MEFARLLELLTDPLSYPHDCGPVEVHQTHISAVFLAGPYAYKIKKSLDLGFLDFTTLDKRHHFCLEEVRLNRRLAPGVYLGVVPIAAGRGAVQVDGEGQVLEWAVWMERLPENATLKAKLARGKADPAWYQTLARRLATFHRRAERGPHVSAFGRWPVVAQNALENFEQTEHHVGTMVSRNVYDRFRTRTQDTLDDLCTLIEDRARRGVPRDTHGDLHLDHVYLFPDRPAPDDLVVVDCIEFNERFRYADPVADLAFLVMDLIYSDRTDLADCLSEAYFQEVRDEEGRLLLPFYTAYRAAVRAKVEGFQAFEPEVPEEERNRARNAAQAHWLLGLSQLEPILRRPALVCVGGLPGTGKTTLSRALAGEAGFTVISSDRVRKELAGVPEGTSAASPFAQGIYTTEWNDRTYRECLQRAEEGLFQGGRVLVDASFREEVRREQFLGLSDRWRVPGLFLVCSSPAERVRARMESRTDGFSDADWDVFLQMRTMWEEPGTRVSRSLREVSTGGDFATALEAALAMLRDEGLA